MGEAKRGRGEREGEVGPTVTSVDRKREGRGGTPSHDLSLALALSLSLAYFQPPNKKNKKIK